MHHAFCLPFDTIELDSRFPFPIPIATMIGVHDKKPRVSLWESLKQMDFSDLANKYHKQLAVEPLKSVFLGDDFSCYVKEKKKLNHSTAEQMHYCSSPLQLFRSGFYKSFYVFVLANDSSLVSEEDFKLLLQNRIDYPFRLLRMPVEGISLQKSMNQAFVDLGKKKAFDSVIYDCLLEVRSRNRFSLTQSENSNVKSASDEEEFKNLLAYNLQQHLDSSPEEILKQAIKTIKKKN